MATYETRELADELIHDAVRMNNQGVDIVVRLHNLRVKHNSHPAGTKTLIEQAITDAGFDVAQIIGLLDAWEQIYQAGIAQGITNRPVPR